MAITNKRSEPGEAREVRYRIKRSKINECLSLPPAGWVDHIAGELQL